MALIKCPECGKEVSDEAKKCPNCGVKLKKNFFQRHKKLSIIIAIVIVLGASVGVFASTYSIVSYEDDAVIQGVQYLKKNSSETGIIRLKEVEISYCNEDRLKAATDDTEYDYLSDITKQDLVSALITYTAYGEDKHALVAMDKDQNVLLGEIIDDNFNSSSLPIN